MESRLEKAQQKFIDGVGRISNILGVNRSVAQLYAYLYLNHKPMSLDEITEALGASKGNISINIRELEKWGAVRKIWVKGSRKDFYEAETDVKKIFLVNLNSSIRKRTTELSNMIEEFNYLITFEDTELTDEEKNTVKVYKDRLKNIEELKMLATNALTFADKLL